MNHASFRPEGGLPDRDFTDGSGSVGLLFRPEAANDRLTFALSLAHASRNPALEELYFFGPHPGNFAFEIGNPDLDSERALGFDASVRWQSGKFTGELTYFRNSIDDYIFRNPISEEEFEDLPHETASTNGEFPFIEFVAADSMLQGVEAHADFEAAPASSSSSGTTSSVVSCARGTVRSRGSHRRGSAAACAIRRTRFQAGGELIAAAKQDRVFGEETPTDGYNLLKLFAAYSFGATASCTPSPRAWTTPRTSCIGTTCR